MHEDITTKDRIIGELHLVTGSEWKNAIMGGIGIRINKKLYNIC